MCYYSSGTKKRGRSSSSSLSMETQYLCRHSKKPRIEYRKSFSSSRGKENKAYEVMGFVGEHVGDRFSTHDSKFVKKRFDRIIVNTEELQVEDKIRSDHHVEMQKKKNQIMRKNEAANYELMGSVSDGGEKARKAARVETLKKRFGRIIATEFQVEDRRRDHHHKVDSVEMQRKKNQILEKKLKEAEIVAEAELKMKLQRKREAAKKALIGGVRKKC